MKALVGQKIGMTQILTEDGVAVPVTLIKVDPMTVARIKTVDSDGYDAVVLASGHDKRANKPTAGQFKNVKEMTVAPKIIKEVRGIELPEGESLGSSFDVTAFEVGDIVDVSGLTKGKGFSGHIKRHNMARGRKTHGGRSYRRIGSIGSMYPQKVFKGKRMAGRDGHLNITVKNLSVAYVDSVNSLIGVKGAIPGPKKSQIEIRIAKKVLIKAANEIAKRER
jgi:large subunit ribosomal protein L3